MLPLLRKRLTIIKIIFFTSRRVEPGVNLTENRGVLVGGMIILLAPATYHY